MTDCDCNCNEWKDDYKDLKLKPEKCKEKKPRRKGMRDIFVVTGKRGTTKKKKQK